MTETMGRIRRGWAPVRPVVGAVVLVAVAAAAVLFVLGTWNPWRSVFLEYQFGNPMMGAGVVTTGALVGLWLAFPVRNEARQRFRIPALVTAAVLSVLGLITWGLLGNAFEYDAREVARSGDGDRAVAAVTDRELPPNTYLKVWTGSGLSAREVGDLGRICGSASVRFVTDDRIEVTGSYGDWYFDLDPDTGEPQQVLGPRCPDGPVPATLGG